MAIAEETVAAARAHGNPFWIAHALLGYGRAFTLSDPPRALTILRQGLDYTRQHRLPFWEALIARDAAPLEAVHGDLNQALALFDTTIDSLHRAGNVAHLAATLAGLAGFFDRVEQPEIAATIYGTSAHHANINIVINLPAVLDHLGAVLGDTVFGRCVATGAAMEPGDAVHYARAQIQTARRELGDAPRTPPPSNGDG